MKLCKCAPHSPLSPSFVNSKVGGGAFDESPHLRRSSNEGWGGAHLPPKGVRKVLRREGSERSNNAKAKLFGRFRLCGGKWGRRSIVCADDRRMALFT
ncbi:MAG: hypothetical protein ACTS53_01250 [Candidatus Hodgkinia cicadicola]